MSGIGKDLYKKKVSKKKKTKQNTTNANALPFFFLQNKNGDHFTAASFSAHLKSVLYGLTGKLASISLGRTTNRE